MLNSHGVGNNTSWISSLDLEPRIDAAYYSPDALSESVWLRKLRTDTIQLASCTSLITDGVHKTPEYVDSGVPFLTALNVDLCYLNVEKGFKQTTRSQFAEFQRQNCAPRCGDVLICKSGKIGTSAVVPANTEFSCLHSVAIIRPIGPLRPEYLSVFLNSKYAESQIRRFQKGAVQPMLHLEEIACMRLLIPSDNVQDAIALKIQKSVKLREYRNQSIKALDNWLSGKMLLSSGCTELPNYLGQIPSQSISDSVWIRNFDAGDRVDPWPHHVAIRSVREHISKTKAFRKFRELFCVSSAERQFSNPSINENNFYLSVLDVSADGQIDWASARSNRYGAAGIELIPGDIIFSTLNPQETRIGVIPTTFQGFAVASPEFSILRLQENYCTFPFLAAAILRSNWVRVQTAFLTRSSSLSRRRLHELDFRHLIVPWPDDCLDSWESRMAEAILGYDEADRLVLSAIKDVECLIEGTLDVERLENEAKVLRNWLASN